MSFIDDVLAVAAQEIGTTEVGFSNSGPQVNQYLSAVGLGPGHPWCAAFVFWVCENANVPESTWNGLTNKAYCPTIESWARSQGLLTSTPMRGDFMLLQMRDSQGQYSGHIGIVDRVDGANIHTIEGNTSPQGSGGSDDNGGGVYRRTRAASSSLYVRWASRVKNEPTGRKVKIFRKPERAVIVIDGKEYPLKSLSLNGEAPQAGSSFTIIADY